ncbi:MAG: DUF397 domain-containing protein [Patescibacteria group bacterium]
MSNKNTVHFSDGEFQKSSFSRHSKKICVLVARRGKVVGVRDSKDPRKKTLNFTAAEWRAFVQGVKVGEFEI